MKINTISPQDNKFTQIMTTIALVPKKLHYIGILPEYRRPTVAIVGMYKPRHDGLEVAQRLAHNIANKGLVIMSSMATRRRCYRPQVGARSSIRRHY